MQVGPSSYETLKCKLSSALKPQLSLALISHSVTIQSRLVSITQTFNHSDKRSSKASPKPRTTSLQRSPAAPIMSDSTLMSYLEGMKKTFWHERHHLQQDEIKLQWAARAAPFTSVLLDTEAPTQPLELTSTSGQEMARQSTSRSWAGMTAARRRASDTVTPLEFGQCYHDASSSEPMSRKRARTSQFGPEFTAKNAISAPSLDINPWQLDSNAPYYGYTNTSTSGPSFKARRTSAGRMPINIPQHSPNLRVYEPAEYVQQSGTFPLSTCSPPTPHTQPQSGFDNLSIPPSSHELPSPLSVSPTTTVSERFTDTTPPTSAAMSRQDSLAASFCGAFGMMRANSGLSEIESGQNMNRQDSWRGPQSNHFSPDGQGVGTPFDSSLYFAHAEGTAIETPLTSMPAVEQLQLPTASDFDVEMRRDLSSSSIPTVERSKRPLTLELHTEMTRDASSDSNTSSTSRISRRSQEQIAQAARPIAPKDASETPMPSSSLSGSQDMLRQRSAPEPKVSIPKLQYSRQTKEKLKCERCNKNPDGYRGAHELHRHMALDHDSFRTAWVCVDISSHGFLSGCTACESKKPYGQDYNAAAHLRRFHFHPKSEIRRTNVDPEERRGGKGGGKDPPMSECRRWMTKIKVRGKDYMTLDDSAIDDAAAEDDEQSKEELGEQDEIVEDHFLLRNVQQSDEILQPHDGAVGQQITASAVDGANNFELAMVNDRQFAIPSIDASFSRSGFQPAFETSFETYFDSDAASSTTPSMNLAYSCPPLSSSAPVAPSFLSSNSADPAQANNNFASSTPDPINFSSPMSTTTTAHTSEDFTNFQSSYGNFLCGISSPNNPQFAYGLSEFPPFP